MYRQELRQSIADALRHARAAAPVAALVSGLLSPVALGAPGDLDPSFGDVGRVYRLPDLYGSAWSVEPQGEEDAVFAGGDSYYSYYYYDTYFSGFSGFGERLLGDGSVDPTFGPASGLMSTDVRDLVVAPDGTFIGVGRTMVSGRTVLSVFRLGTDGQLDGDFGTSGAVNMTDLGLDSMGSSLVVDTDGRITVAGVSDEHVVVLRLLPDGTLDGTFADAGIFVGPESDSYRLPKIVRVAGGGYRVTTHTVDCGVLALTSAGTLDAAFGASGVAGLEASSTCTDLAALGDGRLLLAGQRDTEGFATRLLATGQPDPGFDGSAVAQALESVTALEVSTGGSIVVAGRTDSGDVADALVMRLQADGAADTAFGHGGSTVIDLPTQSGTWPTIHDIALQRDRILVVGGDGAWPQQPFAARLLAADGAEGPGVLGLARPFDIDVREQDGNATVTVRRTGGRAGPVSVQVRTRTAYQYAPSARAMAGSDYVTAEQTVSWGDGDADDKQLVIPLLQDSPGAVPEEYEHLEVVLSDAQGGAGLGTRAGRIAIAPDGEPGGQFSIGRASGELVAESTGTVGIVVSRNYYVEGAVSVTVTPVAGTATGGQDYAGDPVTLTWADDEGGTKTAQFSILDDATPEDSERFSVKLSAPTGGAIVGPRSEVSFTILRSDGYSESKSGGGAVGALSLMLLALAEALRQVSQWVRRCRRRPGTQAP